MGEGGTGGGAVSVGEMRVDTVRERWFTYNMTTPEEGQRRWRYLMRQKEVLRPDPGIRHALRTLMAAGVETIESCQGGNGHAYAEATIKFAGNPWEGARVFAIAMEADLPVCDIRRVWNVIDGEMVGPDWEITFDRLD